MSLRKAADRDDSGSRHTDVTVAGDKIDDDDDGWEEGCSEDDDGMLLPSSCCWMAS